MALRERHKDAIFDAEVYVTEGRGVGTQRLDYLAILCSWAHPRIIGYEVKVSRSDFLRDQKWMSYLKMCNELIFVTGPGVITSPSEIPEACGWQEMSKNGVRLLTKKKAPYSKVTPEVESKLYKHLLMRKSGFDRGAEYWSSWLEKRREDRELGHISSKEIRKTIQAQIVEAKNANYLLNQRVLALEQVADICKELNIDVTTPRNRWATERKIRDEFLRKSVTEMGLNEVHASIVQAERDMGNIGQVLKHLKEKLEAVGCDKK